MTLKSFVNFEEKLTCGLKKDLSNLANFHQSENVKIGTLMGCFCPKQKRYDLKTCQELCVMTMKNNAKSEEEWTSHFKTDMRNLTNFDSSAEKSKNIAL